MYRYPYGINGPLATRRARRLTGWRKLLAAVLYRITSASRAAAVLRAVACNREEW